MSKPETTQHTPGPWFAGNVIKDDYDRDTVSVGPFAADCHYEDAICEVWGENHPAAANAHLIAAAPDLLEALKGVMRVADRATVEFDAARAAIAKAEATP